MSDEYFTATGIEESPTIDKIPSSRPSETAGEFAINTLSNIPSSAANIVKGAVVPPLQAIGLGLEARYAKGEMDAARSTALQHRNKLEQTLMAEKNPERAQKLKEVLSKVDSSIDSIKDTNVSYMDWLKGTGQAIWGIPTNVVNRYIISEDQVKQGGDSVWGALGGTIKNTIEQDPVGAAIDVFAGLKGGLKEPQLNAGELETLKYLEVPKALTVNPFVAKRILNSVDKHVVDAAYELGIPSKDIPVSMITKEKTLGGQNLRSSPGYKEQMSNLTSDLLVKTKAWGEVNPALQELLDGATVGGKLDSKLFSKSIQDWSAKHPGEALVGDTIGGAFNIETMNSALDEMTKLDKHRTEIAGVGAKIPAAAAIVASIGKGVVAGAGWGAAAFALLKAKSMVLGTRSGAFLWASIKNQAKETLLQGMPMIAKHPIKNLVTGFPEFGVPSLPAQALARRAVGKQVGSMTSTAAINSLKYLSEADQPKTPEEIDEYMQHLSNVVNEQSKQNKNQMLNQTKDNMGAIKGVEKITTTPQDEYFTTTTGVE